MRRLFFACLIAACWTWAEVSLGSVLAADPPLSGRLTAEAVTGLIPAGREVHLTGLDRTDRASLVRGVFNDVLEEYGFRLDIAAPLTMELRWGGAYEAAPERKSRVNLFGEAGSRTAPSIGLNLNLSMPRTGSDGKGAPVYTLGCQLLAKRGTVWKAKAVAVSDSDDLKGITTILARQLVNALGKTVSDEPFDASPLSP